MCGFFQVIQRNKPVDRGQFVRALDSMKHRGPDSSGHFFSEVDCPTGKIHFGFGHQRLSILDLDHRSDQPFTDNEDTLLFNGEIYNFQPIKKRFEKQGVEFFTSSDTEVVFNSLKIKGPGFVEEFNGMWSLSFFLKRSNKVFLSRDRFGKKPLFYYLDDKVFCGSSTIKAIKIYLDRQLDFEEKHLMNYVLYGDMFPSTSVSTHFKDICQVVPGSNSEFDLRKWEISHHKYFDATSEFNSSQDGHEPNLIEDLKMSVLLRLVSDRPVALLLSGGIDSSLIYSILHASGVLNDVHVFIGDTGRSDDCRYALRCAKQLEVEPHVVTIDYSKDAFETFLGICLHQEKPFPFNGNAIAMSQMYKEISSQGIPVVLDGTGGDELFGGYWQRHMPFAMREAEMAAETVWMGHIVNENKEKREVSHFRRYIKHDSGMKKIFNPFLSISPGKILNRQTLDPLQNNQLGFNEALCADVAPGGRLGEWLWHNDRNSMQHSVESRSPFLDCGLFPYIYSGYKNKYQGKWNKYELRKAFDSFTPLPTQWRHEKQGFRWDGKHFFANNKDSIIDIIKTSDALKGILNEQLFYFAANLLPNVFKMSIAKRMLGIAGVEYMMKK